MMVGAMIIWGLSWTNAKILGTYTDPLILMFWRFVIAGFGFLPILPFIKKNKWYTKEEFHEAHVEYTLEPFKDLPFGDSSLAEITPTKEMSYSIFGELIMEVDCANPQDIKL